MTSVVSLNACTCPISIDTVMCGKCGGLLLPSGVFSKIELSVQQWFYELESESRLNQTLSMYMAIDRQVRQGAPVTAAVQLATEQIMQEFAGMEEKIEQALMEKLDSLTGLNQSTIKQIGDTLNLGLQSVVAQIMALVEQGKS